MASQTFANGGVRTLADSLKFHHTLRGPIEVRLVRRIYPLFPIPGLAGCFDDLEALHAGGPPVLDWSAMAMSQAGKSSHRAASTERLLTGPSLELRRLHLSAILLLPKRRAARRRSGPHCRTCSGPRPAPPDPQHRDSTPGTYLPYHLQWHAPASFRTQEFDTDNISARQTADRRLDEGIGSRVSCSILPSN